jgi:hypothetical protein
MFGCAVIRESIPCEILVAAIRLDRFHDNKIGLLVDGAVWFGPESKFSAGGGKILVGKIGQKPQWTKWFALPML